MGFGIFRQTMQIIQNSVLSKYIMKIFRTGKIKKPKKPAIENYKISYIDKRSKRYHSIVLTGFIIMFGFVGGAYLFRSGASSTDSVAGSNDKPIIFILLGLIVLLVGFVGLILYVIKRKK